MLPTLLSLYPLVILKTQSERNSHSLPLSSWDLNLFCRVFQKFLKFLPYRKLSGRSHHFLTNSSGRHNELFRKTRLLLHQSQYILLDNYELHQVKNLISFTEFISTSPGIQGKIKKCQNLKDISYIAGNHNFDITPSTLRSLKNDLSAPYWPWINIKKILWLNRNKILVFLSI